MKSFSRSSFDIYSLDFRKIKETMDMGYIMVHVTVEDGSKGRWLKLG